MADQPGNSRREIEKGRQDIADTRSAIAEKLAILEDRVQETVDTVRHSVDLHYQVKQRPWLMMFGSLLVGYTLGRRGGGPSAPADMSRELPARAQPLPIMASEVTNHVKDSLATIKAAAVGAVISTVWAMAKQALLPASRQVDGAVAKPSAQPIDTPPQFANRDLKANGREPSSS